MGFGSCSSMEIDGGGERRGVHLWGIKPRYEKAMLTALRNDKVKAFDLEGR